MIGKHRRILGPISPYRKISQIDIIEKKQGKGAPPLDEPAEKHRAAQVDARINEIGT